MLSMLRKGADGLIEATAFIGTAGIILEVCVILVDVVGRAFGAPLYGAQDITQMGMVLVVFGGMALCDKVGGHISVDIFYRAYPRWLNRTADIIAALLGAAIFFGIAWTIYESAKLSMLLNLKTNIILLPKAYFQWALCACAVITALAMLLRAVEMTRAWRAEEAGE
jgi:TRAP-type C4-dicarboxylate transport system permease small subunit